MDTHLRYPVTNRYNLHTLLELVPEPRQTILRGLCASASRHRSCAAPLRGSLGAARVAFPVRVALAARDASTPPDGVGRNNGCRDTWGGGGIYGDTVQRFGGWYSVR